MDVSKVKIVIYDATGQTIYGSTKLNTSNGTSITGIGFWDGTNSNGRLVGGSAYLAYIEISYVIDAVLSLPNGFKDVSIPTQKEQHRSISKMIGVKLK